MAKQNSRVGPVKIHNSIQLPQVPKNQEAAIALLILSGTLLVLRFVVFPISTAEPLAKWMTGGSALVLAAAVLLYGISRRFFRLSIFNAAVCTAGALWAMRPTSAGPSWGALIVGGIVAAGLLSWLIFVMSDRGRTPGGTGRLLS